MSTILSIPQEILLQIFENLDDVTNLSQCRLVCKRWDQLAEAQMLNDVKLKSNEQALAFYAHLSKDISKCKLIHHLEFDDNFTAQSLIIMRPLMQLAFHPNVETLIGPLEDALLETITEIVNNTPETKFNLYSLTSLRPEFTTAYANALNAFCLDEFGQLESLILFQWNIKAPELERILQGCKQLQELILTLERYNAAEKHSAWTQENVGQEGALKELTISDFCNANLVEHLTFKYPNLEELHLEEIDVLDIIGTTTIEAFKTDMNRIFDLIKDIPKKSISLSIHQTLNAVDIIQYLDSKGFRVEVLQPITGNANTVTVKLEPM